MVALPIAEHIWQYFLLMLLPKCIGIQAQSQGSWKKETFLYANFSFNCFLNACTFQDTFEGSQDVSAGSKLVDISY